MLGIGLGVQKIGAQMRDDEKKSHSTIHFQIYSLCPLPFRIFAGKCVQTKSKLPHVREEK